MMDVVPLEGGGQATVCKTEQCWTRANIFFAYVGGAKQTCSWAKFFTYSWPSVKEMNLRPDLISFSAQVVQSCQSHQGNMVYP